MNKKKKEFSLDYNHILNSVKTTVKKCLKNLTVKLCPICFFLLTKWR